MAGVRRGKKRPEQHLIDEDGQALLKQVLPRSWALRPYRPDYGIDFAVETFRAAAADAPSAGETLGEHFFIQLKSMASPKVHRMALFGRHNVEKGPEVLNRIDKVGEVNVYRLQLEMSELITVERMGIGVPVLLVVADLERQRCAFVCLNDYIDKILIPRHDDYRAAGSRTIHVPLWIEIGSEAGTAALRWYAKRPKLLAAFQRFRYQYSELQRHEDEDWRGLAMHFAKRIVVYDFWDDTEMCRPIAHYGAAVRRFLDTGQPGLIGAMPDRFNDSEMRDLWVQQDVFELWRLLALLPNHYEDIWREWFLPTGAGHLGSAPDAIATFLQNGTS